MTLSKRIAELVQQHGSLRAASRAIGSDSGYLSRLFHGSKSEPSATTLRKLKLERVVTYRRASK